MDYRFRGLPIWAFLFSIVAAAAPARADEVVPSARVRSNVVVRAEPLGPPSRPVGTLRAGEEAELLESIPYFYKVRLPNGVVGYVSKSWTDQVAATDATGRLTLHFMDVGQGDSTLVICPNGATMLIDAGSTSGRSPDEVRQYLVDAIDPHGTEIDYLIVSHPDADHYNLLADVLDEVPIGRAYYVGEGKDYSDENVFDWIQSTPDNSTKLSAAYFDPAGVPNASIDCGAAKVWILAAAVEHPKSRKNAMSIVVMLRMGNFEAVITGDATHATEDVVMSRYAPAWLDVDVLRVGHHGSLATSTSKRWADALSPMAAIFSAGYDNSYGHPRGEVVDRLTPHTESVASHGFRDARDNPGSGPRYLFTDHAAYTEAIYATATNRTIVVSTNGNGYTVTLNR